MKIGTFEHVRHTKLLAVREAVEMCELNMDLGLDFISYILKWDSAIIDTIMLDYKNTEVNECTAVTLESIV